MRRVKRVLRVIREPPVQASVDDHEEVKAYPRPEAHRFVRVSGEPQEYGDQRDVKKHKSAACAFVRQGAKNEKETPLALVNGVELVREKRRKGEVEDEVEQGAKGHASRVRRVRNGLPEVRSLAQASLAS